MLSYLNHYSAYQGNRNSFSLFEKLGAFRIFNPCTSIIIYAVPSYSTSYGGRPTQIFKVILGNVRLKYLDMIPVDTRRVYSPCAL